MVDNIIDSRIQELQNEIFELQLQKIKNSNSINNSITKTFNNKYSNQMNYSFRIKKTDMKKFTTTEDF